MGMSRASKRAQERPNRSSYELVMDKTKISRIQKLGVPDVRKRPEIRYFLLYMWFRSSGEFRTSGASWGSGRPVKGRSSGGSGSTRDLRSGTRFWTEFDDFGVKIDEISWMKDGETWGNARSTWNQANPWIKINKISSNQQITKFFLGLFLVGNFRI